MIPALSDSSRTNQLRLTENQEEIAEKLYLYLFKMDKGIESFSANDLDLSKYEDSSLNDYQKQHRAIKQEIKKRLGDNCKYSDIRYFLSYFGGKKMCFFLSTNKTNSSWKTLFSKDRSNRERILNLIFKVHLLIKGLSVETINGFEELLLIHSKKPTKDKKGIVVWGQQLFINYNHHDVLTLNLSRKRMLFLLKDPYSTLDGEEMGEVLLYNKQNYFFSNKLDGRGKNSIKFMLFPTKSDDKNPLDKFQKTQLYHYQNLMTKLEQFLDSADIAYETLNFQADHYLQNRFIKNIDAVEHLEIINNLGVDFTQSDKQFLDKLLKKQGVSTLSFFNDGKTISLYEPVENEENTWKIQEVMPWANITLETNKNYLVFNKILDEESESSMAYYYEGFWYPKTDIENKPKVDFYSQLKRKINYLDTGIFTSIQGINLTEFRIAKNKQYSNRAIIVYSKKSKSEEKIIRNKAPAQLSLFDNNQNNDNDILNSVDSILPYMTEQQNYDVFEKFCRTHKVKLRISPEFQKVLIELGIKNWIRNSLVNPEFALSINQQSFFEKRFFAIYVRKPRKQTEKAVAVEFLYKDGKLYIKNVLHDVKKIKKQFRPIFRFSKKKPKTLLDNQQYFVDADKQVFISCYTDNFYTPTLIGRENIIDEFEAKTLLINRKKDNKFLPLISYYNDEVSQVKNLICLDLRNEDFLQYYVPPAKDLDYQINRGYRVYHLIGKTYSGETIPTSELIKHPLSALHFSTLTQNILKISDNSQSSLLQKVAKIFIEN